jgi:hypothetical protein
MREIIEKYFIRDLSGRGFTNTIHGRDELVKFFKDFEDEFSEFTTDNDWDSLADMYVGERIRTTTIEVTRIV